MRRRDGGFTLLEVLVALAIAAPALMLMYRQGALSIGMTRTAASYQEAITRAQSRLESLADGGLSPGQRDGDDDGFRWRTRITPVASMAAPRPALPGNSPYARGTTLYAVVVEVSWSGPEGLRTVALDTRRLGPAVAGGP